MPILAPETDIYPTDLLEPFFEPAPDTKWWALYTLSRREKQLMRSLVQHEIPFYSPLVPKRTRSQQGRVRTSHVPLFSGYVFIRGDEYQRQQALTSNCISSCLAASDGDDLVDDLRQIRELIEMGAPMTIESRIEPGEFVRVKTGMFAGFEGTVLRREKKTRLVVAIRFIQQGASVQLEDCQVEPC